MRQRKGQSATEYLMTYGWAVLAIVVVAGVIWNMGFFGEEPEQLQNTFYHINISDIDFTACEDVCEDVCLLVLMNNTLCKKRCDAYLEDNMVEWSYMYSMTYIRTGNNNCRNLCDEYYRIDRDEEGNMRSCGHWT